MAVCKRCGRRIEEGQVCSCSGSVKTVAISTQPFSKRVQAWPKSTKVSLAVIAALIVFITVISAFIPIISEIIINAQKSELVNKTESSYKKIIAAAVKGGSFEGLELLCTNNTYYLNNIKNTYNNLVSAIAQREDSSGYKSVNIINFTDKNTQDSNSSERTISCTMKVEYSYTRGFYNYWTENNEYQEESGNSTDSIHFTYVHEGGKWVLQSMSLGNNW